MPEVNGFEVICQIQQTPALTNMIVIAVSATAFPKTRQDILATGCDDFPAVPVQLDTLLQCLQKFLELEWIYQETAETKLQLTSNETLPLIMPPREELETLLELAEIGCITGIQETFIGKKHEPQFVPFISKVEQFISQYQFEQLVEFIEPHI